MIIDEMIHGTWAGLGRSSRNSRSKLYHRDPSPARSGARLSNRPYTTERHPKGIRIDWDTPILPQVVARSACEEAVAWLGERLPAGWVDGLAARANTIYAHNERFRRRIRAAGNGGRDYLWMFMRHWLAARLREHRPDLFVRLPASYCVGRELPDNSHQTRNHGLAGNIQM